MVGVLYSVVVHVAHLFGMLRGIPESHLLETMGFASLILLGLAVESVFALDNRCERLANDSERAATATASTLSGIEAAIGSVSGIASYKDLATFTNKWNRFRA